MKFTDATRADGDGVVHVVANELTDCWGAACDGGSYMPRIRIEAYRRNDVPTCLRCIVEDARWWGQFELGLNKPMRVLTP